MYRQRRTSRSGPNAPAAAARVVELAPSAATTRSWRAARGRGSGASLWKCSVTPSPPPPRCRICSRRPPLRAPNPSPPPVIPSPLTCPPLPAPPGRPGPAAGDRLAPDVHVDVVPAGELALHRAVDLRVGMLDAAQGLVREHHAEAERVVGRVALPDGDLAVRGELLGERREIQPSRPAAHDRDPHRASPIGTRPPARHPRVGFTLCRFCDDRQYSASSGHAPAPCHRPARRRHASGGLTSSGAD